MITNEGHDPTITPDHVRVRPHEEPGVISIEFHWGGDLDRPYSFGIAVNDRNSYVSRLTRAFLDGALFTPPARGVDVNNQTYAKTTCRVHGRYINADLRKIGY